jgi:hypothetical protein
MDWVDFKIKNGGIESARSNFEDACEILLSKMNPGVFVAKIDANPGDEGIDISVGDIGVEKISVYQCKYFMDRLDEAQKKQIRKSFITSAENSKFEMKRWVLCLPKVLDFDENKWWVSWKVRMTKKYNVEIMLMNGNELISEMKYYKIYNDIFQLEDSLKINQIVNTVEEINNKIIDNNISSKPINQLYQPIKRLFDVNGSSIESVISEDGESFEWIINVTISLLHGRKSYERIYVYGTINEININHVSKLKTKRDELKCVEAWGITIRRVSEFARKSINNEDNILIYTVDDFLDEELHFDNYIKWLENEIISRRIDKNYISLSCKKDEIDENTKQKVGESKYSYEDGGIEKYINCWIDDPIKKHISILGEFGTGKTWFALHYAWLLLQDYKKAVKEERKRPRFPIYISLRDYNKVDTVELLFCEFFFKKYESSVSSYRMFELLNDMGKFVLIFDGFDEMADRIDKQKMINNFWQLAKVAQGDTKIILTCRNEYFPNAIEGRSLLNAELQAAVANLSGTTPQFECLELEKLDKKQIKQLLLYYSDTKIVNRIFENKELLDLATRPVMIDLILEALPSLDNSVKINITDVYYNAIMKKMQRDIKTERTFTTMADKIFFLCELAYEMITTNTLTVNYRMFPNYIRSIFGSKVEQQKDIDYWQYDMMGQTILIRNDDGDYKPGHKSFLEFLLAYKFVAELGWLNEKYLKAFNYGNYEIIDDNITTWRQFFEEACNNKNYKSITQFKREENEYLIETFGKVMLNDATLKMMIHLIDWEGKDISNDILCFLKANKGLPFEQIKYFNTNLFQLGIKRNNKFYINKDLSYLSLRGISTHATHLDYHNIVLDNVDFKNCDLSSSDLSNCSLINADLTSANLEQVKLMTF